MRRMRTTLVATLAGALVTPRQLDAIDHYFTLFKGWHLREDCVATEIRLKISQL